MSKIMIVEDDNNLRAIYGDRLLAEGHDVVSASDGEEALAIAVKEKPDLIISDVMMPKISGFDMLDILRSTPETKDTRVIMMTALSQSEDKDRADKLGADKYLVKSQVTLDDVARVVNEVLASNGGTAPSAPTATVTTAEPFAPTPMPAMQSTQNPIVQPVAPATEPLPTPEPAIIATEPSVTPAPATSTSIDPVITSAPAEPPTQVDPPIVPEPITEPVIATVNPFAPVVADDTSAIVADAIDEAVSDAVSEDQERADIAAAIDNFTVINEPEPSVDTPDATPSAQEHAMSALQQPNPAEESNQIAPSPVFDTTMPEEQTLPATTESTEQIQTEEPTPVVANDLTEQTDMQSPNISKKVIEPLPESEGKPNIYDLYEKEMANEAALANGETVASDFISTPVANEAQPTPTEAMPVPETAEPVMSPPPIPEVTSEAPADEPTPETVPANETVVTPVSMPLAQPPQDNGTSQGDVPHPDDPAAIAL